MDIEVRDELLARNGRYDFNKLVDILARNGFKYEFKELNGPLAIATLDGIFINKSMLDRFNDKFVFFVLLHETAHMKRISKLGRAEVLKNLSLEDFNDFMSSIIYEEVLADRYACRLFYHINKQIYPWDETQQLNLIDRQKRYEEIAVKYFGYIENNETKYYEVINGFIIK